MQTAANTARNPLQTLVGYSNRSIKGSTFFLYGIPWESVGGAKDLCSVVKGLTTTAEIDWDEFGDTGDIAPYVVNAPQIQIQKANGAYDTFFYVKNGLATYDEGTDEVTYGEGWCDIDGNLTNSGWCGVDTEGKVTPGASVWFKDMAVAATEISNPQTSGQVINEEYEIETPVEFRLRAPMLPVSMNLMDASLVTYSGINANSEIDWDEFGDTGDIAPYVVNAPQIQIQKANGAYDTFFYVKNGLATYDEGTDEVTYGEGWCDIDGNLTNSGWCGVDTEGNVPVNGAFWAKGVSGAFTMTFKPLNK